MERATFLSKVKTSLGNAHFPHVSSEHPGTFKGYSYNASASTEELIDRFVQELEALSGKAHVVPKAQATSTVISLLKEYEAERILAWDAASIGVSDLMPALAEAGITIADGTLSATPGERFSRLGELDDIKVGITGAYGALADTGSIAVMNGPGRGRLTSLLAPVHIALLPADTLYPSLPAFLADQPDIAKTGSNTVIISGPSRTADIEMTLNIGVHGPGALHVVVML